MRAERIEPDLELDATDLRILDLLQENCKRPLAAIGEKVGLSAPAVTERIHKLEQAGVITGYVALLDGRLLGLDVTAFIGVAIGHPRMIDAFERGIEGVDGVLECHHVTGGHTLMLKVKAENTEALEELIDRIRSIEGVTRTETMVVLSTRAERPRIPLLGAETARERRNRRARVKRAAVR
ncbi:MAG TPA: Lrp/AsnC family transcriptional regulator [Myxococcota bacterium]|jgi:Lrp/AsnC family leucine-responsive transcriptional regulator|nr:Lrp/AsnC family transcriptional regulator [Myxococcota bacterium]